MDKFSESIFPERLQEIKALTEKIIIEINILSKIDVTTKPENCQVCDSSLHTFKTFVKEFPSKTICKKCPSKIINYLTELEDPTETMWI